MASEDGVRGGAAVSFGQEFAVLPPAQGICQACLHFAGLIDIHTKYIIAAWRLEGQAHTTFVLLSAGNPTLEIPTSITTGQNQWLVF